MNNFRFDHFISRDVNFFFGKKLLAGILPFVLHSVKRVYLSRMFNNKGYYHVKKIKPTINMIQDKHSYVF